MELTYAAVLKPVAKRPRTVARRASQGGGDGEQAARSQSLDGPSRVQGGEPRGRTQGADEDDAGFAVDPVSAWCEP